VGGNLGHTVLFALNATHAFEHTAPDGTRVTADELVRVTATNLHGEFATVVHTDRHLGAWPRLGAVEGTDHAGRAARPRP
jgi:hypothetical protein